MNAVYRWFENWVSPFREPANLRPPSSVGGFIWHYVGQARMAFFAMLVIGGIAPLVEAGLFYFVGRLVDILDQLPASERSWAALWHAAGWELVFMVVVVLVIRTVVVGLSALVDEQTIVPGFFNLVRWQAHRHVSRQSYTFFQNDFAGRIATKVWQAGQATGDLMESFIEVVWFMIVYTVTTLALVAGLDWRLAALVVIWIAAFGWLAKIFLPSIR
jgi:ATP-binding cassette subfamily B multidrug efflux pump